MFSIEAFLSTLKKDSIYAYASSFKDTDGRIIHQVFVPHNDIDIVEDKYRSILTEHNIIVSPAVESKIVRKYLFDLKRLPDFEWLKIGKEIPAYLESEKPDGYAIKLSFSNQDLTVHRYQHGEFKSKGCVKTIYWEADNYIWLAGFSTPDNVFRFVKRLNNFLAEHFSVVYPIKYHRACGVDLSDSNH